MEENTKEPYVLFEDTIARLKSEKVEKSKSLDRSGPSTIVNRVTTDGLAAGDGT